MPSQPDGKEMWGKWTYREIAPPERIVLVNSFSDENGGLTRHPFSASWPLQMLTTSTLTETTGELQYDWNGSRLIPRKKSEPPSKALAKE